MVKKYVATIFFGDNSYIHLNDKDYKAYLKVKNAVVDLLKTRTKFKMCDLVKKLKIKKPNLPKHTLILLATGSEDRGEKPLIRIQTVPNNQKWKKHTISRWVSYV